MELPELEPITIGEIVGRSFRLYAKNFLRFLGIYVLFYIPAAALRLPYVLHKAAEKTTETAEKTQGWRPLVSEIPLGIVFGFLAILVGFVVSAAIFKCVSGQYLGSKVGLVAAYRAVWVKLKTLAMASILWIALLVMGFGVIFFLITVNTACTVFLCEPNMPAFIVFAWLALSFVGMIALTIFPIVVVLWFSLTVQCIMAEEITAWGAMKRSRALVRGNLGKVFLMTLLLIGMGLLAGWLFGWGDDMCLSAILGQSIKNAAVIKHLRYTLVSLVLGPLGMVAMAHLYYDLRNRKEGFEKQEASELEPTEPPQIPWPESW